MNEMALGANLLQTIWDTWKGILADTRVFHTVKNLVAL